MIGLGDVTSRIGLGGSETISPTAHYTGYVWARNGLSHPELETVEGRVLFESLRPTMMVTGLVSGYALEPYLLARHRAIDTLLEQAIERGEIGQVIEVAAGLSPRGWRFTQRHPDLTYVEADLADMAERKRRALERMGSLSDNHRVEVLDALRDDGPESIAAIADELDPQQGLAIITEGLLGYLDGDSVDGVWRRFARTLKGFPDGRYISDLHLGDVQNVLIRGFRIVLSAFVRGRVHLHFQSAAEAEAALRDSGFARAAVRPASEIVEVPPGPGGGLAHILEASTE
jgi:O-methyltransferase involved in polyketide biosynthesis